jgi:hypothetical protein
VGPKPLAGPEFDQLLPGLQQKAQSKVYLAETRKLMAPTPASGAMSNKLSVIAPLLSTNLAGVGVRQGQ